MVKTRYLVPLDGGLTAEVDVYEGALDGLLTAEVEFADEAAAHAFAAPGVDGRGRDRRRALRQPAPGHRRQAVATSWSSSPRTRQWATRSSR